MIFDNMTSIKGWEGLYSITKEGLIYSERSRCFLKPRDNGRYLEVQLRRGKRSKHLKVSRLVALTFLSNPENKPEVNHKDGDQANNKVGNLEWNTRSENMLHAVHILKTVTLPKAPKGAQHGMAKLTEQDVRNMRIERRTLHTSYSRLGNKYGVNKTTAHRICIGRLWKEVSL